MRRWLPRIAVVLAVLIATVVVIGGLLPVGHSASNTAHYEQPPEVVWEAITGFEASPAWRSNVDTMVRVPDAGGAELWRESGPTGPITYRLEALEPPRRLVLRIADEELPFGGTWTYVVAPEGDGSTQTITEDGEVYNWIFRFVSRFVVGHTATIETYLEDLGRKLRDEA
jgi:uncharacterized protein YndB with AHSA1/START domain